MSMSKDRPAVVQWHASVRCCDPVWEDAYRRFESPEQEIRKMTRRLLRAGAQSWPKHSDILEIFCGRGNGLKALASLGFTNLRGVDLSAELLQLYEGEAQLFVGDCRDIRLSDSSVDIVIVQGGLHHLPDLPGDLQRTFSEIRRLLRPAGRFVMVEPWLTPFLRVVHTALQSALLRRRWSKLAALNTMIQCERVTYFNWLSHKEEILRLLHANFRPARESIGWGKIAFVGTPVPNDHYDPRPLPD